MLSDMYHKIKCTGTTAINSIPVLNGEENRDKNESIFLNPRRIKWVFHWGESNLSDRGSKECDIKTLACFKNIGLTLEVINIIFHTPLASQNFGFYNIYISMSLVLSVF